MSEHIVCKLSRRLSELKSERSTSEMLWRDIRDYIVPDLGFFPENGDNTNDNSRRDHKILDNTGTQALEVFANGFYSSLTPASRPWFKFGLVDKDLMAQAEVKDWIDNCEKILYQTFSNSNFYSTMADIIAQNTAYGISGMFIEEKMGDVRFNPLTVGMFYVDENFLGIIDTVFNQSKYTVLQLHDFFGEDLPKQLINQYDAKQFSTEYTLIHAVYPRKIYDGTKTDARNMPFASIYWIDELGEEGFISESGFHEQPYIITRFTKRANDKYGIPWAKKALGDIKMLQQQMRDILKAGQKMIDPPMMKTSNISTRIFQNPGSITTIDGNSTDGVKPLYQINPDISVARLLLEDTRSRIKSTFMNELFLTMPQDQGNRTATEVTELKNQRLLLLGSILTSVMNELLDPIITRVFFVLMRAGRIPKVPDILGDVELKMEYISVLASAQKQVATGAMNQLVAFVGNIAGADQSVLDNIDLDQTARIYSESVGAPAGMLRSEDEIKKIRQQRAQAQAQAQQMQQYEQAANIAKTASQASTEQGNVLSDFFSPVEQAR